MAVQYEVAYSSTVMGAGIVAGAPYWCMHGSRRHEDRCLDQDQQGRHRPQLRRHLRPGRRVRRAGAHRSPLEPRRPRRRARRREGQPRHGAVVVTIRHGVVVGVGEGDGFTPGVDGDPGERGVPGAGSVGVGTVGESGEIGPGVMPASPPMGEPGIGFGTPDPAST
jgi:hypothetical protein